MAPIVIYGPAVSQARDRIRSAQSSTMVEVLLSVMQKTGGFTATGFAAELANWVNSLQPAEGKARANQALASAQARANQMVHAGSVYDIFAVGDVLRAVGEFFEFGGGDEVVEAFREGLRNQIAFNKQANRARTLVPDYALTEKPDLGIYLFNLLDRSTVKYMERFYGPYIGADISGSTTDALDVLAYFWEVFVVKNPVDKTSLQEGAATTIGLAEELVPIATMVLQYHHSLMECGLALSLPSVSMSPANVATGSALDCFNPYDFGTLTNQSELSQSKALTDHGNDILQVDLGGRGLVIVRDAIDIEDNPYADVEIGLLMEGPSANTLFNVNETYTTFANHRQAQMIIGQTYQKSDPSLFSIATKLNTFPGLSDMSEENIEELARMNSIDLKTERVPGLGSMAFSNLDAAIASLNGEIKLNASASAKSSRGKSSKQQGAGDIDQKKLNQALAIMKAMENKT